MRTATKVRYLIRKYAPGVRPVAWNLGAIAAEGSPQARQLFRDVLLASASIPGLFPPVAIEAQSNGRTLQELHADGGITTPFFLAPEPALLGRGRLDRTSAPAHAYASSTTSSRRNSRSPTARSSPCSGARCRRRSRPAPARR
jgi:hypothetical protein